MEVLGQYFLMNTQYPSVEYLVEVQVKAHQANLLAEAEHERLVRLVKAVGTRAILTPPAGCRNPGKTLINLSNWMALIIFR